VSGVLYGSANKTIISSNTVVRVDTTTLQFQALKGIKTSTITFLDGTTLVSTSGLVSGGGVWGSITGTITGQADLMAKFNAVGVSTGAIATSTGALQTSVTSLAVSTTALNVSTGALQTQINNVAVSTGVLSVSTAALQTQINAVAVSTGALQTQVNAVAVSTGAINAVVVGHTATLAAVAVSTAAIGLSTGTIQTQVTAIAVSTGAIQTQVMAIAVSTGTYASTTSTGPLKAQDWNTFNGKGAGTIVSVTGVNGSSASTVAGAVTVSVSSVSLSTQVVGNLPVTNLFSGTGASGSTFLSGTGWVPVVAQSSMSIFNGVTLISSPVISIAADGASLTAYNIGTSSVGFKVNPASGTLMGNTFNGASQLVQLSAGSQFPAKDGNLITNVNAGALTGTAPVGIIPGGSAFYIQNQIASVQQSSFSVLTGTVTGSFTAGQVFDTSLAPNFCLQSGTNGQIVTTGASCSSGAGGLLTSTQAWSGQNSWTTPAVSSFTGVVTAPSFVTYGPGPGEDVKTEGTDATAVGVATGVDVMWASSDRHWFAFNPNNTSTYTVVGSSTTPTLGHAAVWSANGALVDGGTLGGNTLGSNNTWTGSNTYNGAVTLNGGLTISGINTINFSTDTTATLGAVIISSNVTRTGSETVTISTNNAYAVTYSTPGGVYILDVSSTGHINSQAVAGTTVTSCGTNPSLVGSDIVGKITTGTGSPTACTLTFSKPYTNVPVCLCGTNAAVGCDATTISATGVTFTLSVTETKINYICMGSD
jgi:hypothetical protein